MDHKAWELEAQRFDNRTRKLAEFGESREFGELGEFGEFGESTGHNDPVS